MAKLASSYEFRGKVGQVLKKNKQGYSIEVPARIWQKIPEGATFDVRVFLE